MSRFNSMPMQRSGRASAYFPIAVLALSLLSGTAIGFFAGGRIEAQLKLPETVAMSEPKTTPRSETIDPQPIPTPQSKQTVVPAMVLPPIVTMAPKTVAHAKQKAIPPTIQSTPKTPEPKTIPKKEERVITFKEHVLPVFQTRCIECHGDPTIKSGFDMRTLAKINMGGNGGPGMIAGEPDKSYLYERIFDGSMPPRGKSPLSNSEKKLIREWIASGAK